MERPARACAQHLLRILGLLSGDHRHVGMKLGSIGYVLLLQGKLDEALNHINDALSILRKAYGEKSIQATRMLFVAGDIYRKQGKLDEALKLFNKVCRYKKRALGHRHHEVGGAIYNIAVVYMEREQFHEALGKI
jgi:tetratricopeptide (TPR) repeat protein